ncbi:unnamed protein product [Mesocestoides corti]|uniref:GAT domain-containing protein n=1 Tax=Mesocestoides corti TaxID=53468 RepID=A0A3P6HWS0_MESCO|nr:unnamed protein product [Mesocestoides corti]
MPSSSSSYSSSSTFLPNADNIVACQDSMWVVCAWQVALAELCQRTKKRAVAASEFAKKDCCAAIVLFYLQKDLILISRLVYHPWTVEFDFNLVNLCKFNDILTKHLGVTLTVRALDGSHQLGVRQGEPIPQVLQVVAVNGYPVATRSGQDVIIATSAHPSLNQLQHHQQRCCSQPHLQPSHASVPAGIYTSGGDRTLIDQEGTVRRLSSAQRERLSQDLAVVQTNLHILNDMLTELQPDAISSDDLELLQDLHGTCRMMQQRVADFLSQVADDAVTLTLIQLNDELNSAFQR